MKKNISINISGIIFHIEEDGYNQLKEYLESITRYFSTFEESTEIMADIESRIAEIFLAKLTEGKQVITAEDVESLIGTMGSIRDFQAIEEQEIAEEKEEAPEEEEKGPSEGPRRLFRDENRQLLGGVCSGIAYYFNIDPLWIRLIVLILFLGSYGILLIIYVVLWIVVPGRKDLPEDQSLKKMFRNPDDTVVGGVASGIAAYFGIEVAIVRLLFALSILLGGTGIIAYIILWIILPEAKTITDKVQMKGEPVTLSNIESNIKKSFNVKSDGEENLLVKILLFPFRLIAVVINGLGKALGPIALFLVHALRIVIGIAITATGLLGLIGLVILLGVLLGIFSGSYTWWWPEHTEAILFYDAIRSTASPFTVIAAFFAGTIPVLVITLLGISIIAQRIVFNAIVGWTLFVLFFLSSLVLAFKIPAVAYQWKEEGEHRVTNTYDLNGKTAVLKLVETGFEEYQATTLRLRGHEGPDYKLVQTFESRGSSRKNATENAKMVIYRVDVQDSIFTFDSNIQFDESAVFRAQRLEMTLYIPYNEKFMMEEPLKHILRNTLHRNGYNVYQMEGNTWLFNRGGLRCITCVQTSNEEDHRTRTSRNGNVEYYDFEDFSQIEITGSFMVDIEQDNNYEVRISGKRGDLSDLSFIRDGDKLAISDDRSKRSRKERSRKEIRISIALPDLESLSLSGASKGYIVGFESSNLDLELSGAAYAKANVGAENLDIDLSGASELELTGEGFEMEATLRGASQLEAYDYIVENANIETHGASGAKVNVTENLEVDAKFASSVRYRGDPKVRTINSGDNVKSE